MDNKEILDLYLNAYVSKKAADTDELKDRAKKKQEEVDNKDKEKSLGQHALEGAGVGAALGAGAGGIIGSGSSALTFGKGIGKLTPFKHKVSGTLAGGMGGMVSGSALGGSLGALIGLIRGHLKRKA